jgi:ABC-type phosphonate transport system ATPase subunit
MPSPRRADPLQCLYKRRQNNRPLYLAARASQRAADRSAAEAAIVWQTGADGLDLVRAVTADGHSVEEAARAKGAHTHSAREATACGWLPRRSLDVLAVR